ncbi:MAG: DUF4954 family protein [Alistipes sp.]|nr:DUF4954 family protein [Alistipes sp.]
MTEYRKLTQEEIARLEAAGNTAQAWERVEVAPGFRPEEIRDSRFEGDVRIGRGAQIRRATVSNYRICDEAVVSDVCRLECRHESSFGNGVRVAAINECGGRALPLCNELSAQAAYLLALCRHRPAAIAALERIIDRRAETRRDRMGTVGKRARVVGARFIREVHIAEDAVVEGASRLENGTVLSGAFIGIDVTARDFIAAEGAHIDGGVSLERCFAGECCTLDRNFTAVDTLLFANCHCENGEAVSVFAGPYTVSHHKSSLLIAGMFSFFNAGSGANQSNHLFKSGAVHQSIHLRGCKFGSSAYVMAPAVEGPFTLVLGRHTHHHDTTAFPFSYLVEQEGRSSLMPGANLTSYGTVRDTAKWPERDRRTLRRDRINFEVHNPYLAGGMIDAVNTLNTLEEARPDAESYVHNHATIKSVQLRRGLKLYNRAIVASLGAMLGGAEAGDRDGSGRWSDLAGQYVPRREVRRLLDDIEAGRLATLRQIEERLDLLAADYPRYARNWAEGVLAQLLGHAPSPEEIAEAIAAGRNASEALAKSADDDRARDCSSAMAVGYGTEADTDEEKNEDYRNVRGLK